MSTETPTPVRLRQGESISLLTGQVEPSTSCPRCWALPGECACPVAPANDVPAEWELPRYVATRLIANDLNALRSTFQLTACAWTTEACHRYVARCGQHPRDEIVPLGDGVMDY